MNYTVIGDVVNTASRLTALNKEYKTAIIVSEAVQKQIGNEFVTRPLDFVAVKGKKIKLTVYELMGTKDGELAPTSERLELCRGFTEAYAAVQEGRLEEGRALFLALGKKFPDDGPTQKHLSVTTT
jgi:adenylate cyclase